MRTLQLLWSSILQVAVFSLIPFLWWCVTARKRESFFSWIGLKKVTNNYKAIAVVVILFCAICVVMQMFVVPFLLPAGATVQQSYAGQGVKATISILIFGMIQTGLSEEILFRGFLLKRLSNRFGYRVGNIVQASIFGIMHGVLFFMVTTPLKALIIIVLTGLPGWIFGYLNERKCNGSIIPSYLCHGIGNCFISFLSAFSIL